ncbi:MAG: hypothetical protein F6K44_20940 [Moorea sp. SIO3E2]|nr:hypothetical protein [Moorena sp. SIO3E2]
MGGTTPVAHGGNPQDRTGSPRPRCLPKTALPRFSGMIELPKVYFGGRAALPGWSPTSAALFVMSIV